MIVRSNADPDVFAVGYSKFFSTSLPGADRLVTVMTMVRFDYGILELQRWSSNSTAIDLPLPP